MTANMSFLFLDFTIYVHAHGAKFDSEEWAKRLEYMAKKVRTEGPPPENQINLIRKDES